MSTADGFPWGATGNLQSAPLRVLFGHDLTFIQNTKCAKQSNNVSLLKRMQTMRPELHTLGWGVGGRNDDNGVQTHNNNSIPKSFLNENSW